LIRGGPNEKPAAHENIRNIRSLAPWHSSCSIHYKPRGRAAASSKIIFGGDE
jgi:hypothetical protein